jgi:hypothetical protein
MEYAIEQLQVAARNVDFIRYVHINCCKLSCSMVGGPDTESYVRCKPLTIPVAVPLPAGHA